MSDEEIRTKKRKDNSADYPRNRIKRAKLQGDVHYNHSNKLIPKKKVGPACNCTSLCFSLFSDEEKLENLKKFYDIPSKNQQDLYLQGLITCHDVKHRRVKREIPLRQKSFKYHILKGVERLEVCHSAFLSLFSVSKDRVKRIRNLLLKGEVPIDRRGKQQTANAIPSTEIAKVLSHISSFPTKESHYSSKTVNYLPANLSVKKMFSMFKRKYSDSNIKYEYYNKLFKENFALRFGRPAVDTCCVCEQLDIKINSKVLNDVAKRVATAEKTVHKARAAKFYKKLEFAREKCKTDDKFLGLSYDYMQNVPLPIIPVQDLFYLRQLTVSIFCISNLRTGKIVLFLYHEGHAGKGPNEVCSFILKYIEEYVDEKIDHLMLFCDNCGGQNKNNFAVRMNIALVDSGRFKVIEQVFPLRGHSFLPCDRAFGVIKRSLRRTERLYTVFQLLQLIIESAKKDADFFTVHLVTGKDISDFKDWTSHGFKKTAISMETNNRKVPRSQKIQFCVSKFHHFIYKKAGGDVPIVACEFIDGTVKNTFLLKCNKNVPISLDNLKPCTEVKRHINVKKMADLHKCVQYVPDEEKISFWDEILNWPTTVHNDDE